MEDKEILKSLIKEAVREVIEEMETKQLPEVLTLEQTCKYLQVSDTWLKANLVKLKIPYFKTGRHYKFNLECIREWIYNQHKKSSEVTAKPAKRKASDMKVSL
jgi:excisionase family DNA binding protein